VTCVSDIRAVFFDVGGTLITPWPSVGAVYARVGAVHGFHAAPEAMETAFRAAWKRCKQTANGRALFTSDKSWWRQLVYEAMDELALDANPDRRAAYFDDLFASFARADAWRIFDDVVATLRAVRARGIHVGALSNWDERLRPLLNALNLADAFDSVTVSCEVGAEKPDLRVFDEALRQAGVNPHQALHIGDNFDEDVRGATAAGIRALWLVRDNASTSTDRDVTKIQSLGELIELLPPDSARR
jgi:putative hydrolase of the HAD superfamily